MADNTLPVTINFASPGSQPPVYVAGEFTDWDPEEMDYSIHEGEHRFRKDFTVKSGISYQYKFRLGPGDWWVLDETAPIATDDAGNRNNVLIAPAATQTNTGDADVEVSDTMAVPKLIVEKSDNNKVHGDDFGENATSGQKEAHEKRAADAEPDETILAEDVKTIDFATTAAQVADSAAELDEGADDFKPFLGNIDPPSLDDDSGDESGRETPLDERVPLFPHERPEVFNCEETLPAAPLDAFRKFSAYEQEPIIDYDDPTLEYFPTERQAILQRIRTSSLSQSSAEELRSPRGMSTQAPSKASRSSSRAGPSTPLLEMISEKNEPETLQIGQALVDDSAKTPSSATADQDDIPEKSKSNFATTKTVPDSNAASTTSTVEDLIKKGRAQLDAAATKTGAKALDTSTTSRDTDKVIVKDESDHKGTSTSVFTEDGASQVKSRAVVAKTDESQSAVSAKSNNEKVESFWMAIWRSVFVEWIGGFLGRLWRSRGVFLISAFLVIAIAVAWAMITLRD